MKSFRPADFLPGFVVESSVSKEFNFDLLAGHRVALVFIGDGRSEQAQNLSDALVSLQSFLKSMSIFCYITTWDRTACEEPRMDALRNAFAFYWDSDRKIHQEYGMSVADDAPDESVGVFVIRENLRLHEKLSAAPSDLLARRLKASISRLPTPMSFQPAEPQAPVLQIPEVFDRSFCRVLCDHYRARGGTASGFMRDVNGVTKTLLNPKHKRRRDCEVDDDAMIVHIRAMLQRRVRPEIKKAFAFDVNRIERFTIGCYDAEDFGFFMAHRDNTTKGTSHRRFAVTINLNAEDYEGGELWFPEYGKRLYKPATGSAVVFSCSLLHEARPVTKGTRFALLPFLYDDAAAAVRRANIGFVSDSKPEMLNGPLVAQPFTLQPVSELPHPNGVKA
jgi:predicted 2-oxoglutarate/Fe(II)-dependent dioxygenase YbiX